MSLIRFLVVFGIGTVLSWAAWFLVLRTLDPFSGGWVALALFHVSFWLGLVGLMTIIGFFLRYWLEKETILFQQIGTSLRQAILISSGATVALFLQGLRWLSIWSGIVLFIILILVELFYISGRTQKPRSAS